MRPVRVVVFAVFGALVATGCGTVTVEVSSDTDIDKIGVETTAETDDPPVTVTTVVPAPTTSEPPRLDDDDDPLGLAAAADDEADGDGVGSQAGDGESTTTSTTSTTTVAPTSTTTTTTTPPIPLEYHQVDYGVFARAGDLDIVMPVARYETVGFHESGHDGAFQLDVLNISDWTTLASRGRGTGSRTAADIVVAVGDPILAPIDGTVIRAGGYTLYCDHTDNFIVIEPTGRPGWELKIFHFEGLAVDVGDEVVAATTLIGSSGRVLPFVSQVDEFTAEPSNPHVHIEVIDTSIPDRPSSGGGC